jgi:hypothetical protein
MIIALSAKARRGKDTVANMLRDTWGFTVLHWADPLYDEVRQEHSFRIIAPDFGQPSVEIDGVGYDSPDLFRAVEKWVGYSGGKINPNWTRKPDLELWESAFTYAMREKDAPLLQWWGTEYRREHFGKDYWIQMLHNRLPSLYDDVHTERRVVIADTRFPNEANAVLEAEDGIVIRIDGPAQEDTGRQSNHPSEIMMDDYPMYDFVIRNKGTLEELEGQVKNIMDVMSTDAWVRNLISPN